MFLRLRLSDSLILAGALALPKMFLYLEWLKKKASHIRSLSHGRFTLNPFGMTCNSCNLADENPPQKFT